MATRRPLVNNGGIIYELPTTDFLPGGLSLLTVSTRTSNTILAGSDNGTIVDITSGTFTQTFTAAATLGAGWWCYLRNSGTGDITLDPNGTETIDTLTSYIMYPEEVRLVLCNGTSFETIVINSFKRIFTTTENFINPPGYRLLSGLAWSGGGSGQKSGAGAISLGGAGGGCFPFTIELSTVGTTIVMTVGAGGAARGSVNTGAAGGNTNVGNFFTVFGAGTTPTGLGGAIGINAVFTDTDPNGASGFGGAHNASGSTLGQSSVFGGSAVSSDASLNSGHAIYGGGAGGSINAAGTLRSNGISKVGGNGGAALSAGAGGSNGVAPGGGGGATQTGTLSGAGARGEIRIWGIV